MKAYAFSSNTWEARGRQIYLCPGLFRELHARQVYIVRYCLKNKQK